MLGVKFAHDRVLPTGRYLSCVLEPEWAKQWSRMLKWRLDDTLDPYWCADFAWFRDHRGEYWSGWKWKMDPTFKRGLQRAYAWLPGHWVFCDITNFFPSVSERRLRRVVHRLSHSTDPALPSAVWAHFERIDYDLAHGLPTGSAVACALANAYLLDIDHRFRGDVLRYGDNYAIAPDKLPTLRNNLLDIGLRTELRPTFTKSHALLSCAASGGSGVGPVNRPTEGRRRSQRLHQRQVSTPCSGSTSLLM